MLDAMKRLIEIFAARSPDHGTLDELHRLIGDRDAWHRAYDLFQRIRDKTLVAEKQGDLKMGAQFCFEEACAKTLYNLMGRPAPFDTDSPFWIVPNAIVTARYFEIDERDILRAIVA